MPYQERIISLNKINQPTTNFNIIIPDLANMFYCVFGTGHPGEVSKVKPDGGMG